MQVEIQILFNTSVTAAIYLILANSFSFIYYPTKFFHLAHAIVISLGAYFVFLFAIRFPIPFAVSIPLAIAVATLVGLACEIFVYCPMRKRNTPPLNYLISSLGLYILLQNCVSIFFGDDTKIINTIEVTVGHQIFGAYITTIQIITVFISIAFFIAVNLFLNFSSTGKSIRAVSSNPDLSNIYGIPSNKTILISFGIGSSLAATAGILSAMDTNMSPTFGFNLLLYGVVAMIIGGVGSTTGLIAGSFLVATAQHLAGFYLDTKWMDAVTYFILILFLIWKPLGFSGKILKKIQL
ncbi:MAG: branched-chain amino acid ABC transporter permease [Bacteroidetes bacterium]|nr:branched-chain amino acid ABC transporter permease [Bacteroidota bacterium]